MPNTTQTGRSTNDEGKAGETPNNEWMEFSKEWSGEQISDLPSDCERNCETFLNVQVPSCQNFALGDTQIRKDRKMGFLPDSRTAKLNIEDDILLLEDQTEPFSLYEEDLLASKPIFSKFIEELLFESSPLFDDNDDDGIATDTEQAEAQPKRFLKPPIDGENISRTLKAIIENLEGLSKSLDSNTKPSLMLPDRSQHELALSKREPGSTNPPLRILTSSSLLLPNTIHIAHGSTRLIWSRLFQNSQNLTLEHSKKASRLITSSLNALGPNLMMLKKDQSDSRTSSPLPETITESLVDQSDENLAAETDSKMPSGVEPSTIGIFAEQHQNSVEPQLLADGPSSNLKSSIEPNSCLINFGNSCDQTVQVIASRFGFKHSSENWDVLWINRDPSFNKEAVVQSIELYKNLKSYQRINHFPGSWGLGLKDLLAKNLNYMHKHFPSDYSFFPNTWILPIQSLDLARYLSYHPGSYFVIKPTYPTSGCDMEITNEIPEANEKNCEIVCQLYLNPFLIDGCKFDFRVYVLVTSCDPLRIFVHTEGLARFATEKYEEPTQVTLRNARMHLTKTRVQDDLCFSLRRISTVFQWLRSNNIDYRKIQASMDDAITKTIISNLATLKDYYQICFPCHSFSSACFETLVFDMLLDDQLNVYLLDVDCSPSFDSEGGDPFETELKTAILSDIFMIVNLTESKRNEGADDKENSRRTTLLERLLRRKQEISAAQSQIEWEDSHLGGFRKIYPPTACCKAKYYKNLIYKALKNPNIV